MQTDLIRRICDLSERANVWFQATRPAVTTGPDGRPAPSPVVQLHGLLHGLPAGTLYTLLVIMLVGRGDLCPLDDFLDNYWRVSNDFARPWAAVAYMADLENLAIYLAAGVLALEATGFDEARLLQ
jgi:hypothetical protein